MKKVISLVLAIIFSIPYISCFAEQEQTVIYVSPDGSDSGDGSWSKPYLTLGKAVTESRKISGEKRIRLRGGRYSVTKTTSLGSNDSGLIIENVYGETPELSGAKPILFTSLKRSTDPVVMERLVEQAAKDNLMEVYLPDVGITEYGTMKRAGFCINSDYAPTLTYNDEYLTYGEYPNKGYCKTSAIITPGNNFTFTINDPRYENWVNAEDIWVTGFFCQDWAESVVPAQIDFETGYISAYSYYEPKVDRRVRFFNLLEEIDVPGEFYINRETGYLYIYPPEGMKAGDELMFSTCSTRILNISGASNVTVQGIKFSGTSSQAINANNCPNLKINACEVTATGSNAITVSNCTNAIISNCYVHDVGGGGISVSGGNRQNLTPGNIRVENCHVERFMNYKKTYSSGISINGVGNIVSHCEINDAPHQGLSFSGNDHIIEYSDFHGLCNDTADCGAIYTGRNWTMRGNEIRYNYFHDMDLIDTTTGMKSQAVYLDDCFASAKVYGNYFYRCSSVALYGGGRYNTFENNIMLDNAEPFVFDNRGLNWRSYTNASEMGVYSVPYNTGIWAEKYPELSTLLEDEPLVPKHNIIRGNVIYNTPDYRFAAEVYEYGTVENNITLKKTSGFANYKNRDFTVLETSEIYDLIPDFKTADFKSIGRYDYTLQNPATAPSVSDFKITGSAVSGDTLSLSYTFEGSGYYEGKSKINWYSSKSRSGPFNKISGATNNTFKTDDSMRGLYILAEITPVNCEGVSGSRKLSVPVLITRKGNSEVLTSEKTETGFIFKNTDINPLSLGIFAPEFTVRDGFKVMTDLSVSFITVGNTAEAEANETDIIITMDNLEPVK